MSDLDKRIDSLLNRLDRLVLSDRNGKAEGEVAFDAIVNYLNYVPQHIDILHNLLPLLTKTCPAGTKRTLQLVTEDCLYLDKVSENASIHIIGIEGLSDEESLEIKLELPKAKKDEDPSEQAAARDAIVAQLATVIEEFSEKHTEFNGSIVVEIS